MSRSVSAPSSVTNTSPCWNGLIVPASTLMYGSSLRLVTRMPREARIAARDEAAIPFPSEETTPPVTNTNLVMGEKFRKFQVYIKLVRHTNRDALTRRVELGAARRLTRRQPRNCTVYASPRSSLLIVRSRPTSASTASIAGVLV